VYTAIKQQRKNDLPSRKEHKRVKRVHKRKGFMKKGCVQLCNLEYNEYNNMQKSLGFQKAYLKQAWL